MNKKTKKFLMFICISVVSITLIVISISAAYTNINKVKRVISTQSSSGTAFSSNYLNLINKDEYSYDLKRIYFSTSENSKTVEINVSNYVHNNPSIVNEHDIIYTLTFTLVDVNGNPVKTEYKDVSVQVGDKTNSFENGVCTIENQTLTKKKQNTNTYTLTIPKKFIDDKINIKAEVIPGDYSHTDQKKLARIFTFSEYSERTTAWTGYFSEKDASGYDGFNYIITGQGKGTITLTWDSTQLEISKVFLDTNNLTVSTDTDNKKKIEFSVDSNTKSQYNIQFYKTTDGTYTSIESLGVNCTFTETPTTPSTE